MAAASQTDEPLHVVLFLGQPLWLRQYRQESLSFYIHTDEGGVRFLVNALTDKSSTQGRAFVSLVGI
jgi:hypothetical protein